MAVHECGLDVVERYRLHVHDATIVASALDAGCEVLLNGDLQDGQVLDRLLVTNALRPPSA